MLRDHIAAIINCALIGLINYLFIKLNNELKAVGLDERDELILVQLVLLRQRHVCSLVIELQHTKKKQKKKT